MDIVHLALGGCWTPPPVTHGLTEDTDGHIGYVLEAAMAAARRRDVARVEVVTRRFSEPSLGPGFDRESDPLGPKCRLVRLATRSPGYLDRAALADEIPSMTEAFLAYLSGRDALPDVIHAHFSDAAEVALAARARFGIPVIYTPHELEMEQAGGSAEADPRRIEAERRAIAQADAVIASSRDECERQIQAYGRVNPAKVHRAMPGIVAADALTSGEATVVAAMREALSEPDKPMILAAGRPLRRKNLRALVELYARSPMLRDKANLVILAGQWGSHDETEGRAVQAELEQTEGWPGMEGRLFLPRRHGPRDRQELFAACAASGGVFVDPAPVESFELALLEAAAHGVPAVATERGGAADLFELTGHGVLCDPSDAAQLGAVIRRVLDSPRLHGQLSAAGRAAARVWTWDRYARCQLRVAALLSGKSRPAGASSPSRLLVSDIDDTLTGDPAGVRRFCAWVAKAQGWGFAMATGRTVGEARFTLDQWDLPIPSALISAVGTEVHSWSPESRQFEPDEDYAAAISRGWDRPSIVAALRNRAFIEPQSPLEQRRFKLSYVARQRAARRLVIEALSRAGLSAKVVQSHGPLIDVIPAEAGKEAAMRHVTRAMGVAYRDCVSAGDSGNDRDMLEQAFQSILVGNYAEEVANTAVLPNVYLARASHADGVLEGLYYMTSRGQIPA